MKRAILIVAASVAIVMGGPTAGAKADFLYVGNFTGNITEFDTTTGVGTVFTSGQQPQAIAFDSAGNLYGTSGTGGVILKYSGNGIGTDFGSNGGFGAFAIAFDSLGNLYAASGNATPVSQIGKLDPSGNRTVLVNSGLNYPSALAFDSLGFLYASNQNSDTIVRISTSGVVSPFVSTPSSGATSLAFDTAGDLYAAYQIHGTIIKYNTNTGMATTFATGLGQPTGLAFDSAGNLFVSEYGKNTITKFDTSTGVGTGFATLDLPEFMAFGPDLPGMGGRVYPTAEPATFITAAIGFACVAGYGWCRRRGGIANKVHIY